MTQRVETIGDCTVHHGDSRDVLKTLADASIDSCVCDPPYALVSIGKRFGTDNAAPVNNAGTKEGRGGDPYARAAAGFMGKKWDTGETAFDPAFWVEVMRVLKPGGHLIAFSGTRTYHRLACAIEDAGFEIRDQIGWIFGSGFPKSHDVSKGIDKAAGAVREVVGAGQYASRGRRTDNAVYGQATPSGGEVITAPATDAARQWQGWGTALKPAWEPCVLARKPLIGTVASNVLAHGTGALNIDASRIDGGKGWPDSKQYNPGHLAGGSKATAAYQDNSQAPGKTLGRWPANVIHDGSEEVVEAFPETASGALNAGHKQGVGSFGSVGGDFIARDYGNDSGSAARFFYSAKADAADRCGSKHPTVKPIDLMAYLVRLVTPPGGVVLDPFAGSGSTGMACLREGFGCILIEREAEYVADIHRRIAHVHGNDAPLFAEPVPKPVQPSLLDGEAA
jgi:site-specific DNA-methyltransferase (adenine-specific)